MSKGFYLIRVLLTYNLGTLLLLYLLYLLEIVNGSFSADTTCFHNFPHTRDHGLKIELGLQHLDSGLTLNKLLWKTWDVVQCSIVVQVHIFLRAKFIYLFIDSLACLPRVKNKFNKGKLVE